MLPVYCMPGSARSRRNVLRPPQVLLGCRSSCYDSPPSCQALVNLSVRFSLSSALLSSMPLTTPISNLPSDSGFAFREMLRALAQLHRVLIIELLASLFLSFSRSIFFPLRFVSFSLRANCLRRSTGSMRTSQESCLSSGFFRSWTTCGMRLLRTPSRCLYLQCIRLSCALFAFACGCLFVYLCRV